MDEQEIKNRLGCYRPGIDDPKDPEFAGALEVIQGNHGLEHWFKESQAFDAAFRAKLTAVEAPAGLLARLRSQAPGLASVNDGAPGKRRKPREEKVLGIPRWNFVAAAAAILLAGVFVASVFNRPASASFDEFRGDMAHLTRQGLGVDYKSPQMKALSGWLQVKSAPIYRNCPDFLGKRKGVGCKMLPWHNHIVSLVCFEEQTGRVVHLFIVNREALGLKERLRFGVARLEGCETGGWVDDENAYVLVASAEGVTLDGLY